MRGKKIEEVETPLYEAYMALLNEDIEFEHWLENEKFRELAFKLSDLQGYFLYNSREDGRLLFHPKIMQVIWGSTHAIMEKIAFTEDKEQRKKLLEVWEVIQGYVDSIVEDAQITTEDNED